MYHIIAIRNKHTKKLCHMGKLHRENIVICVLSRNTVHSMLGNIIKVGSEYCMPILMQYQTTILIG